MMLINVYWNRKTGDVLIPSVAKTEAGYWLDMEPVERASAADASSVLRAVRNTIERAGVVIPTPLRRAFPKPVVLSYSSAKNWSAFEKQHTQITVSQTGSGEFQIQPYRKSSSGDGVEVDLGGIKILSSDASAEDVAGELFLFMRAG